ncbi:MAG: thiamine-phosphate kinase [Sulfobacillus sp.]
MPEPGTVGQLTEAELIERLKGDQNESSQLVRQGIGDDAAVLSLGAGSLVSVDSFVQGRHFDTGSMTWTDIGWRALAAALSDLAAMGGRPLAHLLAISMPGSMPQSDFDALVAGLAEAAAQNSSALVGGNLAQADQVTITATVIGQANHPVARHGGQVGDRLVISGQIGLAAWGRELILAGRSAPAQASQAFLRPQPAWAAAALLADGGASAMIDVTDGLALDLSRLLHPATMGADLVPEALPLAGSGDQAADLQRALYGGDDYCLLAAVPERVWPRLAAAFRAAGLDCFPVGRLSAEPGLRLGRQVLSARGYDHFGGDRP